MIQNATATPHMRSAAVHVEERPRFLKVQDVTSMLGISRASLYVWMGAGHFPRGTKIGPRRVAWLESDVRAWMSSKVAA